MPCTAFPVRHLFRFHMCAIFSILGFIPLCLRLRLLPFQFLGKIRRWNEINLLTVTCSQMFCSLDFSAGNSIKYAQAKALEGESEREKKVFKWAVTYLWGVKWVFLLKATPMFFFILEKGRDTEKNRHEVRRNGCPFWTGHLLDRFEWANGKVRRCFSLFSALENWFTFLASVLPLFFLSV